MSAPTSEPDPLAGIARVERTAMSRVPVRMRGSNATMSGWRLTVTSAQGPGWIDLIEEMGTPDAATPSDISGARQIWRGEGIFLGWNQARLAAAHAHLLPPAPAPDPSAGQQWG